MQTLATGVGLVSLGLGVALTLAPSRTAAFLGWEDLETFPRVIAAGDLAVGVGLLVDRKRSRWMRFRTLLNVVIFLSYAMIIAGEAQQRKRALGWAGLMLCLTAFDFSLARRLEEVGVSKDETREE